MRFVGCPTQEELSAYVVGGLSDDESQSVGQHVLGCPLCKSVLQTLAAHASTIATSIAPFTPEARGGCAPRTAAGDAQVGTSQGRASTGPSPDDSFFENIPTQLREYKLLARLGRGGMGTVYKALHTRLKRVVAVKVLSPDRFGDATAVARFEREMEAVGRLNHPRIVQATDAGEEAGTHFLVMEFVEGIDLSKLVKFAGPLCVAEACELARQAAIGLQHAHDHGLVHRDVKPSNVMLAVGGVVKVLDLGLARLQATDCDEITASGQVVGTADYLAPEQALDHLAADARSDVYSLGCTLYKLLTGEAPFGGRGFESARKKIAAHALEPARALDELRPDIPQGLVAVVARMLAKDPLARFDTCTAVADALLPFAAGADLDGLLRSIVAKTDAEAAVPAIGSTADYRRTSEAETPPPATRLKATLRRRMAASGLRVLVVLAMAFAGVVLWQVIIRIRGKGEPLAVDAPPGTQIEVGADGAVTVRPPRGERVAPVKPGGGRDVAPGPRPVESAVLTPRAWVTRPAKVAGARTWTIDTRTHQGAVRAVTYSPDGRWLATAGADGTIRVWKPGAATLARGLVGHAGEVQSLAWSSDSNTLASGGTDGTVRLWDASSGAARGRMDHIGLAVSALSWATDGSDRLASVSHDGNVQLWSTTEERSIKTWQAHEGPAYAVAWSPESDIVATAGADGRIRLWQIDTDEPVSSFGGAPRAVKALAWSPNGDRLAACGDEGLLRIWDASDHEQILSAEVHRFGAASLAWSRDGSQVATGGGATVAVWDAATGHPRQSFEAHRGTVLGLAWSPEDDVLVSAGADADIIFWAVDDGRRINRLAGHNEAIAGTQAVAWSADGTRVATGGRWLRFWETSSGKLLAARDAHQGPVTRLAWSPAARLLASAGPGGKICVWRAGGGELVTSFPNPGGAPTWLAWSPDGGTLVVASADGQLRLWECREETFTPIEEQPLLAFSAAWSTDGHWLATIAGEGEVTLYPWHDGRPGEPAVLECRAYDAGAFAWSPLGSRLAIGIQRGQGFQLWQAETRQCALNAPDAGHISAMAWSPDGKLLATCNFGEPIARLWDAGDGKPRHALHGHRQFVSTVAWSPDGQTLATASADGHYRFWEATTGRMRAVLVPLLEGDGATIHAEGDYLASAVVKDALVFLVETDDGQAAFTASQFAERFGWKNRPERVVLGEH